MMKGRTLGILVAILVVLGLLSWATKRSRYATVKDGGYEQVLTASLDRAAVQKIRAWVGTSPDDVLELERSGDGWVVASRWGWPAKQSEVDRVLDDLTELKGEKRASSEDVLADFQIDEEGGLHVQAQASGGTDLCHVVVGKAASRGGGFVRREGSNDVYLTQAGLRSRFGLWGDEPKAPEAKRWIDLKVFQKDRNEVDRLVLADGAKSVTLEKEIAMTEPTPQPEADSSDSTTVEATTEAAPETSPQPDRTKWTWKPDASGPIDSDKADSILGLICSLYAQEVADPSKIDEYGLDDPSRTVTLTMADGNTETIAFGGLTEDEKRVYFRVGTDGKPAEINKSMVDRIFQDRSELRANEG
jgi:hypothetical protein